MWPSVFRVIPSTLSRPLQGTWAGERRTTVEGTITIQHWMILAFLAFMDVVVLGCLFLIAMNKIYLLP